MGQDQPGGVRAIIRLWAKLPWLYDISEYVAFAGRPRTRRQEAVDALGLQPGGRVLEIGCGTGRNFPYILSSIGPSGRLVCLDHSSEMLGVARTVCKARGWDNVTLVQGDAAELDVGKPDFDGVLSVLAVNGLPDHLAVLRRAHAVLRSGGRYVVCDIQQLTGWARPLNPLVRLVLGTLFGWDADLQIPADLESIFGNVGVAEHAAGAIFVATSRRMS